MSKFANPGELRTPVYFFRIIRSTDEEGVPVVTPRSVFLDESDNPAPIMAKWVNLHGTEVFTAMQLELREPVTLTLRYSPQLTDEKLVVKKDLSDDDGYEIISIDDVENRHVWLEIKIQRKVAAK